MIVLNKTFLRCVSSPLSELGIEPVSGESSVLEDLTTRQALPSLERLVWWLGIRAQCLPDLPRRIVVRYDPAHDNPDTPWKRHIRINNGLNRNDPAYEGALFRIRLTPDGHLIVGVLEPTDGFSFGGFREHLPLGKKLTAQTVHQDGGSYTTLGGQSVSPFVGPEYQALIRETVTTTVQYLGLEVAWQDDLYLNEEDL